MAFFSYIAIVFQWAAKNWWAWVWGNIVFAAIITAATAAIGLYLMPAIAVRVPALKPYVGGDTMDSVVQGLLLAGLAAVVLFVVFLVAAPSDIYHEQQRVLKEATEVIKEKDEALTSRRPEFSGEARSIVVMGSPTTEIKPPLRGTVAILYVILRNTGEPSIAEDWSVEAVFPSGKRMFGELANFKGDILLASGTSVDPATAKRIAPDMVIVRKTAEPVAKGAAAMGYILVEFFDTSQDELMQRGTRYVIRFTDIYRKQHEFTYDTTNQATGDRIPYHQGDL